MQCNVLSHGQRPEVNCCLSSISSHDRIKILQNVLSLVETMSLKISETTVQVMRNVHTQFPSVAQKRHVLKLSIVPERQRLTPHTC